MIARRWPIFLHTNNSAQQQQQQSTTSADVVVALPDNNNTITLFDITASSAATTSSRLRASKFHDGAQHSGPGAALSTAERTCIAYCFRPVRRPRENANRRDSPKEAGARAWSHAAANLPSQRHSSASPQSSGVAFPGHHILKPPPQARGGLARRWSARGRFPLGRLVQIQSGEGHTLTDPLRRREPRFQASWFTDPLEAPEGSPNLSSSASAA